MPEKTKRIVIALAAAVVMITSAFLFFTFGYQSSGSLPLSPNDSARRDVLQEQNSVPDPANSKGSDGAIDNQKPAFDIVRISRGGTGIIAGRMTPGAEIELKANDVVVANVTADENGEWVILLDEPLESGSVEFTLKGQAAGGDEKIPADDVVVVSVPKRDDQRLLERTESGVVAVMSPRSGEGASVVLQRPGARAPSEIGESLSVTTVDYGDGGASVIAGTGVPRYDARLYMDGKFVGYQRVDDEGVWKITVSEPVIKGRHVLRVDQTIGDGTVELRIEQPFETGFDIDTSKSAAGVIVQPGNTLWHIARQLYGTGYRYTVIFRENSEQIKDPNLIYPGQLFELPQQDITPN